jgi:hypothetical protein
MEHSDMSVHRGTAGTAVAHGIDGIAREFAMKKTNETRRFAKHVSPR